MKTHWICALIAGLGPELLFAAISLLFYPNPAAAQQENQQPAAAIGGRSAGSGDAEQGSDMDQLRLGFQYLHGTGGLPKDYTKAEQCFRNAAEQGNVLAQFNLGMMCFQGNGIAKNYEEAAKWFRRASDQGNAPAQCMLGALYVEGLGVSKDYVQAYKWLALAVAGSPDSPTPFIQRARDMTSSLTEKMTPTQLEEARGQVERWEDEHVNKLDSGIYLLGRGVTKPVVLANPMPRYTEQARQARVQGSITLQCIIRKDGTVDTFKVLRGLGYGLEESAIRKIAREWRYIPATYKGKPVDVQVHIEVSYRLY